MPEFKSFQTSDFAANFKSRKEQQEVAAVVAEPAKAVQVETPAASTTTSFQSSNFGNNFS